MEGGQGRDGTVSGLEFVRMEQDWKRMEINGVDSGNGLRMGMGIL